MCLICEDLDKNTLTFEEAWNNLREIKPTLSETHFKDVSERVFKGLDEEQFCLFCVSSPCSCNWDDWENHFVC